MSEQALFFESFDKDKKPTQQDESHLVKNEEKNHNDRRKWILWGLHSFFEYLRFLSDTCINQNGLFIELNSITFFIVLLYLEHT